VHDPSNPYKASKHPYDWALSCDDYFFYELRYWALSYDDYFSSNWGIEHLAKMILYPTILNDESGLSEMSVAA
jgi:hypothetical protein